MKKSLLPYTKIKAISSEGDDTAIPLPFSCIQKHTALITAVTG